MSEEPSKPGDYCVEDIEAAHLRYVSDKDRGITRIRKGDEFIYMFNDKQVDNEKDLQRIKNLVIPPAWQNVWICKYANGHIQCTGLDSKNRKQYRYHIKWQQFRNENKFHKLIEFGEFLPRLRLQMETDIANKSLTEDKVIATVLAIMERTYIRIGNAAYEKANHSYGLTTLKDRHIKITGDRIEFAFVGKKGIKHKIDIKNKKLARIIKECRDIPGKELFQYKNEAGEYQVIDSGKVNNYIKRVSGHDFSAKDFRTWAGTLHSLHAFKEIGEPETVTETKKKIVSALDYVSGKLGNTRTVCKKYYVHPAIINLYETKCLKTYLDELDDIEENDHKTDLSCEEKLMMKILKANDNKE